MLVPNISENESRQLRTYLAFEILCLWRKKQSEDNSKKEEPKLHATVVKRIGRMTDKEVAHAYVYLLNEKKITSFDDFYSLFRKGTHIIPFLRKKEVFGNDFMLEARLEEVKDNMNCTVRNMFETLPEMGKRLLDSRKEPQNDIERKAIAEAELEERRKSAENLFQAEKKKLEEKKNMEELLSPRRIRAKDQENKNQQERKPQTFKKNNYSKSR